MNSARNSMAVFLVSLLSVAATPVRADPRCLRVHDLYRGDELAVRPFGHYGIPTRAARLRLSRFWRFRTGERIVVHPHLIRTLVQVHRHFGARRLDLLSGYRAPADGRHLTSYHQVGHAADVSIGAARNRSLFEYCRTLADLGCGLYPRGQHYGSVTDMFRNSDKITTTFSFGHTSRV